MRKIANEADARACLRAAKTAGVAPTEWARAHGIDGRSLNAWRVNLGQARAAKRESGRVPAARLVELVPTAPSAPRSARYAVRVSDAEIELADDFREETLVRLVRALRTC